MNEPICEVCEDPMTPLVPESNPVEAEWYCEGCHKSYKMPPEHVNAILQSLKDTMKQKMHEQMGKQYN